MERPVRKRQQKPESDSSSSPSTTSSSSKNQKKPIPRAIQLIILLTAVAIVLYFTKDNWLHKLNREKAFTIEELKKYDGSDPSLPIYIGVKGKVFDVTSGRRHYGKQGSYNFFAGRDATRSFVTGCFDANDEKCTSQSHVIPDDLTPEQVSEIENWVTFYTTHKEYFYVGYIKDI